MPTSGRKLRIESERSLVTENGNRHWALGNYTWRKNILDRSWTNRSYTTLLLCSVLVNGVAKTHRGTAGFVERGGPFEHRLRVGVGGKGRTQRVDVQLPLLRTERRVGVPIQQHLPQTFARQRRNLHDQDCYRSSTERLKTELDRARTELHQAQSLAKMLEHEVAEWRHQAKPRGDDPLYPPADAGS